MGEAPDEVLVAATLAGDESAFAQLAARHRESIAALAEHEGASQPQCPRRSHHPPVGRMPEEYDAWLRAWRAERDEAGWTLTAPDARRLRVPMPPRGRE